MSRHKREEKDSIMLSQYPVIGEINEALIKNIEIQKEIITKIRAIRQEKENTTTERT